jgi:hypothetical protein
MSLGSNGVDWVRSLRKIQLRVFLLQKSLKRPSRASLQRLYRRKPKLQKRNKHESWVKRGGLGAFVAENSTASFFVPKVAKTASRASLHVCPSKTETPKRNKHESWVKRGGLGAFVAENSTASFFVPKVAKTASRASLHVCTVENRNYENATNMSLGSNGVDWVRSLRKIQLRVFLLQKSLKRPSRASFATFVPSKTETTKTQQT